MTNCNQTLFVGDTAETMRGTVLVVNYQNTHNVTVRFDDGFETVTSVKEIRSGFVLHPLQPTIAGVGFRGVGEFTSKSHPKARAKWSDMLHRVYDESRFAWKMYGGRGVQVTPEWHNFQSFAAWITKQPYYCVDGYELDKDILKPELKLYSPESCCLVPREVNIAMLVPMKPVGDLPLGVARTSNTPNAFRARVSKNGKLVNIGVFPTSDLAYQAYKTERERYVHSLADTYAGQMDERVCEKLKTWRLDAT